MYSDITFENNDGVYKITFQRPKVLNAVSLKMVEETLDALSVIQNNNDCRVLIFTGSGKSFNVGADTTQAVEMDDDAYKHYMSQFSKMLSEIEQLPYPVIAMLNGYTFGGGAEISLVCDIRFGNQHTQFRFPGASYGIVLSASTLSTILPIPKVKELLFSSSIVDADEAYRIGLLDQLVDESVLESFTYGYAEKIVKNSHEPVIKAKEALNNIVGKTKSERRKIEQEATNYLMKNTNQRETFTSFSKKRKSASRDW